MKQNSNIRILFVLIVVFAGGAYVLYKKNSKTSKQAYSKSSEVSEESKLKIPIPMNSGSFDNEEPGGVRKSDSSYIKESGQFSGAERQDSAKDGTQHNSDSESDRFRDLTTIQTKEISKRMVDDEIKSLEQSIKNDELVLRKLEKSGTDIETYQFVKGNLEKRIERLKFLKTKTE